MGAYARELAPWLDLGRQHAVVENDVGYLAAGIGPVAATFGLTHFLEDYRPDAIFAVGTAGFVGGANLNIGDVVNVVSVSSLRPSVSEPFKTHVPQIQPHELQWEPHPDFADCRSVNVLAPQEISSGSAWAERLQQSPYTVEHLESFAYAFVAHKFKIPLTILLGLTNQIGPNAQAEWQQNEAQAMRHVFLKLRHKIKA